MKYTANELTLCVTAGTTYDKAHHVQVPVNASEPIHLSSPLAEIDLNVRIKSYRGLPRGSPTSSSYFSTEPHASNKDQYSICFRFTPKKPTSDIASEQETGISAADLQFGNNFDCPIRNSLPMGFNGALKLVQWCIDPGLEGDAYADEPYLYGPALSSFSNVHVGPGTLDEDKGGLWFEEGGDDEGLASRRELQVPDGAAERAKWALNAKNKAKWVWEYGKTYGLDFHNPYLDFGNLTLQLPGIHFSVLSFWDGQPLRYVLRNRSTDDVYLVVILTLHPPEDFDEEGNLKETIAKANIKANLPNTAQTLKTNTEPTLDDLD